MKRVLGVLVLVMAVATSAQGQASPINVTLDRVSVRKSVAPPAGSVICQPGRMVIFYDGSALKESADCSTWSDLAGTGAGLSAANTWTAIQTFSADVKMSNGTTINPVSANGTIVVKSGSSSSVAFKVQDATPTTIFQVFRNGTVNAPSSFSSPSISGGWAGQFVTSGGTPTMSGCGTGATVAGNDSVGRVTLGTSPSSCIVVFSVGWTNAPVCSGTNETAGTALHPTPSTSPGALLGVTLGTGTAADVLAYQCRGY